MTSVWSGCLLRRVLLLLRSAAIDSHEELEAHTLDAVATLVQGRYLRRLPLAAGGGDRWRDHTQASILQAADNLVPRCCSSLMMALLVVAQPRDQSLSAPPERDSRVFEPWRDAVLQITLQSDPTCEEA